VLHAWQAHKELVRALAVSCDGLIASCSQDSSICIWRAKQPLEAPVLAGKGGEFDAGNAVGGVATKATEAVTMTEPSGIGAKPAVAAPIYHPLDDVPSAEID